MTFSRTTLDTGITVVTERMNEVRSATVGFWFDVGSRDEPTELAGTSHFLEHLLFKGTPSRTAKDIADGFDAVGGEVNAFTGKEYTCYYSRVLDDDLDMATEVLCDMITNSSIASDEFESERGVILEEIAMHEDTPDEFVHDLFYSSVWRDHPLGRPVLGSNDSIGAVSRDLVVDYWHERYSPVNLVVAAAGHLNHDSFLERVDKLFVGRGDRRTDRTTAPPGLSGVANVVTRPTEQAHIVLGTKGLARDDEDRYALAVIDTVLGGGMSSRLFQEVREKRGLAYSVYSYKSLFAGGGTFAVYAGTTPQNAGEVLDIVQTEIDSMVSDGISEAELRRAKGHLRGSLVLSAEDAGSRMNRLARQQISTGEILSVSETIEKFDSLTMDDIRRVSKDVLGSGPFGITVIGPFDEGAFDRYAA